MLAAFQRLVDQLEELFLGQLTVDQGIDAIDHDQGGRGDQILERMRLAPSQGLGPGGDEFITAADCRPISPGGRGELGRHRRQQVALAGAVRPMQVERVVGHARLAGDPTAGGQGQGITGILGESIQGALGAQDGVLAHGH